MSDTWCMNSKELSIYFCLLWLFASCSAVVSYSPHFQGILSHAGWQWNRRKVGFNHHQNSESLFTTACLSFIIPSSLHCWGALWQTFHSISLFITVMLAERLLFCIVIFHWLEYSGDKMIRSHKKIMHQKSDHFSIVSIWAHFHFVGCHSIPTKWKMTWFTEDKSSCAQIICIIFSLWLCSKSKIRYII